MRIRAASFTDANTIAQQTQRMKFKLIASFLRANEKLVRLGFGMVDKSITAFNSALKYNIENAVKGTFPTLSIDLTKARLSDGNRDNLSATNVTSPAIGQLQIDWSDTSATGGNGQSSDKIYLSIGSADSGEVMITDANGATRMDETVTLTMPAGWSGRNVTVIGFTLAEGVSVAAKDPDQVSTSVAYGTVTIL